MRAQWNTGRQYTANGQRIVAEVREDGIFFNDIDRMLWGKITTGYEIHTERDLKTVVMGCYDNGRWKSCQNHEVPKWQD